MIRLIYRSNQFNFPQNGFVKGDIVYTNASTSLLDAGVQFDKDALIYFTDGTNEPRKINAYRAFLAGGYQIHGDDIYAEADFICACPRVPLDPITFTFDNDETRSVSNFQRTAGFKFAYQYVYNDGIESAISPYSDVAFPPSVINQGAQTYVDHSQYNRCILTIPSENIKEVDYIRVLAKEGVTGDFGVVEEIRDLLNAPTQTYYFYNDRISRGVSTNEVNKQFDAVPRWSVAQSSARNRMTYSNYLDGFDNVKTNAEVVAVYKERGEDFKTFSIKVQPSIAPLEVEGKQNAKTVGFVLDCSDLPSEISQDTLIDFKLTLAPDQNWHLYDFIDGQSYHQSKHLGPQDQESNSTYYNNANVQTFFHQTDEEAGLEYLDSNNGNVFGLNTKVNNVNYWNFDQPNQIGAVASFPSAWSEGTLQASVGTSAGNPLIFKGAPLVFKVKIRATENINSAPEVVASALEACFTLQDVGSNLALSSTLNSLGFEIEDEENSFQARPSYSYNLNIQDGDIINQPYAETSPETDDFRSKLICSVKAFSSGSGTAVDTFSRVPIGHFIVNKATLKFYCESVENDSYIYSSPSKKHLRIGILSVEDIETVTCVHEIPIFPSVIIGGIPQGIVYSEDLVSSGWIAIKPETVQSIITGEFGSSFYSFLSENGINNNIVVNVNTGPTDLTDVGGVLANKNYLLQLGYLDHDVFGIFDVLDGGDPVSGVTPKIRYCLMDGEGGPGGGPSRGGGSGNAYDDNLNYLQGSVSVQPRDDFDGLLYDYIQTVFYTGSLNTDVANSVTCLPLIGARLNSATESLEPFYPEPLPNPSNTDVLDPSSVNYNLLHSHAEVLSVFLSASEGLYEFDRSFKTEANHDFGIVYYDQRGRHGFVNHLDTVFVNGYSSVERGAALYGPAHIRIKIFHDPPEWAHHYKIVYSGNTTVQDFIQYTAGGAFAKNTGQEISETSSNIYVSLNYLQGHPISYVSSFGARTPEGGLAFYSFQPGDKLRVISYGSSSNRQYPHDVEFEVVDFVKLGGNENPLFSSSDDVPENAQGDFVVLKNNPSAFGFSFTDVAGGGSFWDQNCVFELRTPQKERNLDELVYYEIGRTFDVVFDDDEESPTYGQLIHQVDEINIDEGDVWFRPVAVNVKNEQGGVFQDLIQNTDGVDDVLSEPNFVSVLLETSAANDLFRSDNSFIGRPNLIFDDAAETIREATITYSDPTNPESNKHKYSSFNYTLANFKDLDESYGGVQYMGNYGDQLVVIQRDKLSLVPVEKNIISDASGNQSLIASKNVLGETMLYPGYSGCDLDPSSVYDSGETFYFANKAISEVYRWTKGKGVEVISDKGLSSMIKAVFKQALSGNSQIRVVGGYDPIKKEYLLTILNPPFKTTQDGVELVQQPGGISNPDPGPPQPPPVDEPDNEDENDVQPEDTEDNEENLEFMSAQQAIDYLIGLSAEADTSLHPTFSQLRQVLNVALANNSNATKSFMFDSTDDQNVGSADLLDFLGQLDGDGYSSTSSIYVPQPTTESAPPPQPSKPLYFKNTQEAVNYLIGAGNMTVQDYFLLREYIDNKFAVNMNQQGVVTVTDILEVLALLGSTTQPDDSAFGTNYPGPSIDNPTITAQDAVLYIINQQTLTVAQYFQLAQYIKPEAKADSNESYEITVYDVLIALSLYGDDNENLNYDLNDIAFAQ
jgi:hypothetical protein